MDTRNSLGCQTTKLSNWRWWAVGRAEARKGKKEVTA